jgi:hypothetical protein
MTMTIPAKISARIEAFLAEKSKSEGGFAPVGQKDMEQLSSLLEALLAAKYEKDPDGDLPVSFQLVDRTRFENTHFWMIPHAKDEAENDLSHIRSRLRAACANLSIAQGQIDRVQRSLDYGVAERMESGRAIQFGDHIYERRTALTNHATMAEAARKHLKAFVESNPPDIRASYQEKEAWEEKGQRALEAKLGGPVRVRAFAAIKNAGKISISVELLGVAEKDKHRRVGFFIDDPRATPTAAPAKSGL